MAIDTPNLGRKLYKTMASVRTGVLLILIVGIFAAVGTVILQRPATDPDVLQRTYSPQTLVWLDRFGLTDVYHTWWFITLLALVSISIVCASLERWPNAWRFYARPYTYPEAHFRLGLQHKTEIPINSEEQGLNAARFAFHKVGIHSKDVNTQKPSAIFAERHRFAVMAVYVIHASLLLIFIGGMIDGMFGYRGYLQLVKGETKNVLEMRDRADRVDLKTIPFSIRCDDTGQENYADGSPKKWWSKLTVVEDGRDVESKEIVVNDPLIYRGLRFYQASYGQSGNLESLNLVVKQAGAPDKATRSGRDDAVANRCCNQHPRRTVHTRFLHAGQRSSHAVERSGESRDPAVSDSGRKKFSRMGVPRTAADGRSDALYLRIEGWQARALYGTGSLARTGPMGRMGWLRAHGMRSAGRVLHGPHAVLGGTGYEGKWRTGALGRRSFQQES